MKAAKTIAEAQQQTYTVPTQFDDKTWRSFAGLINGYAIAEELGFNLIDMGQCPISGAQSR